MMNDKYEPNANQTGQTGIVSHAPAMFGMAAGYDSLFQILWRGRWLIVLCTVLAAAGAYAYLLKTTPTYISTSQILVEKPNPQPHSDVPRPVGSTLGNYLQTQASMITSPEIIAAAMKDPNVATLPTFAAPNYVEHLIRTLSASVAKGTDIIEITASSAYPEDAARIVNAVVRAYSRWHEANRQFTTADLLKDLNRQLENHYRELQLKRREWMLFEQRHPEVVESTRGGIVSQTLDLLKQELAGARLAVTERDSYYQGLQRFEKEPEKLRQYVYGHQTATTVSVEDTERTRLKEELHTTQSQIQATVIGTGATPRSQLTLLQNREAELQKKIGELDRQFVQNHISLAKALSEDARAREQKLTEMYEKEFSKVQNLSGQDSEYAFIRSECEMIENLCNSFLSQINQLDLNARRDGLNIHVLEKAAPAKIPSAPQAARIMGIGLVLGLVLGTWLSLVRDWRDQRVRSGDEIATILGVPILGFIPSIPWRGIGRGQRLRFASNSRESEACRAIRTTLLCGTHREQARTILVTSPGAREGKTLLVSNLGMAMAQAGQRTLIVDADLRKPMKQRVFTVDGHGKGLVDILAGTAGLREAIRSTDIDRLDVLEGGQSTPNPSELLSSRAFAIVLEQLKGQYDRVLVDSPPVGLVTDAQILATLCDSTLLVIRAEESSRVLLQRARDALLAVGARIVGTVVNDVSRRDRRYGYYGGYGYYCSNDRSKGHKTARGALPRDTGPGPGSGAWASERNEPLGEAGRELPPADVGSDLGTAALPLEIREYDCQATGKKPGPDIDSPLENRVLDSETRESVGEAGCEPLPTNVGPRPENEASASNRKNGRKATRNGLPGDAGVQPESGALVAEETSHDGRAAGTEPSTDADPRRDDADMVAAKWKKWLSGSR